MSWIIYSILAALIWAIVNTVDKYALTNWVKNPTIPLMFLGVIGLIASIFVYFIHGISMLSPFNIFLAIMAGILYVLMSWSYYRAAKIEEISRIVPIFYITPLFILILATIFLGEIFTPIMYLGIFFIIIGAITLSTRKGKIFSMGKAFWFMIASCFCLAVNQIITKYLLKFADFWTVFSWIRITTFISLIPLLLLYFKDFRETVKTFGKKVVVVLSISESANMIAVLFITIAAATGYITLVNALSSTQPFFLLAITIILSIFFPRILQEEQSKSAIIIKLFAILLMFVGTIIIS